jgi:streptogramin lyase
MTANEYAPGANVACRTRDREQHVLKLSAGVLLALVAAFALTNASVAEMLRPGDLLVADSQAAVLRIDSATGEKTVVSSGGCLIRPFGLAMDAWGNLFVSDTGSSSIVRIDPATGRQTVIASGGDLGSPYGIAVDGRGHILAANARAIIRIDPVTQRQRVVSSGGNFVAPLGIAVGRSGELFVADAAGFIFTVDSASGAQHLITSGGHLLNPIGISLDSNGQLLVGDCSTGKLIQINPQTGDQTVLFSDGVLMGTVGMAVDLDGKVILSNPDAFGLDGGIMRWDPTSRVLTCVATGSGDFVNPRCLVVVRLSLLDQLCPCAGPVPNRPWKNHGEYMAFAAEQVKQAVSSGEVSEEEGRACLKHASGSDCGKQNTQRSN